MTPHLPYISLHCPILTQILHTVLHYNYRYICIFHVCSCDTLMSNIENLMRYDLFQKLRPLKNTIPTCCGLVRGSDPFEGDIFRTLQTRP